MKDNTEITHMRNNSRINDQVVGAVIAMLKDGVADLYKSHATKFLLEEEGSRAPPINSISGMGTVAAEGLYNDHYLTLS
ncbi:hypothetical protein [Desulfosporosinus sp. OT]|uniref:hypothetical protein n=1 Tax=Desulfosporosinus sp. OT TaxID=913865 RepID=UPI000223ABFE|nr:hypothetical protein [Desulfosporosinus sp. OT]EGW39756.1 DNA polymerase III, alpha subunit [Desulfosporosinus sp. OT]